MKVTLPFAAGLRVDAVMPSVQAGDLEVAYGFSQQASQASRAELEEIFNRMNQPDR